MEIDDPAPLVLFPDHLPASLLPADVGIAILQ